MHPRIVTCNTVEDIECKSYPNLSQNTVKIKYSSVLFSLFIGVISLLFSLLFGKCGELNNIDLTIGRMVLIAGDFAINIFK